MLVQLIGNLRVLAFVLFLASTYNTAFAVTVVWDVPTENADGSQLSDLSHYVLYRKASNNNFMVVASQILQPSYTIDSLANGTYLFVVSAVDTSGNESPYSNELAVRISNSDNPMPPVPGGGNGSSPFFDFDGDGISDIIMFGPSSISNNSLLHNIIYSNENLIDSVSFGQPGDLPVYADYNGDGLTDLAVVRKDGNNLLWIIKSDPFSAVVQFNFGKANNTVVNNCDFDNDGKADPAVLVKRKVLMLLQSSDQQVKKLKLPLSGVNARASHFFCADITGDGASELLFHYRTLLAKRGSNQLQARYFLQAIDNKRKTVFRVKAKKAAGIVALDFNGDGRADPIYYNHTRTQSKLLAFVGEKKTRVPIDVDRFQEVSTARVLDSTGMLSEGLLFNVPGKGIFSLNVNDLRFDLYLPAANTPEGLFMRSSALSKFRKK